MIRQQRQAAPSLDFGQDYPKRDRLFAFDFFQLLTVPSVAHELTGNEKSLLVAVATMEHEYEYRDAVVLIDDNLRPRVGVSQKTLVDVRRRCVEKGWLHYEPSHGKGEASRIWVTIPPRIGLKKLPIQYRNYTRCETGSSTESSTETSTGCSTQTSTQSSPSYIPNPNPIPSSSPGWPEAEAAVGKNLNEADRAIADCRKHGLEPSDVLALVEWWKANAGHFRKPSGALDYALRHAKPSQRSDWSQAFPTIAERPGRHPAELKPSDQPDREILKTVRQLELKFPDLKDMTGDEIAERYELPEALRKRLAGDLKWRYVRSDALKLDVLKFLDQFELAERN